MLFFQNHDFFFKLKDGSWLSVHVNRSQTSVVPEYEYFTIIHPVDGHSGFFSK